MTGRREWLLKRSGSNNSGTHFKIFIAIGCGIALGCLVAITYHRRYYIDPSEETQLRNFSHSSSSEVSCEGDVMHKYTELQKENEELKRRLSLAKEREMFGHQQKAGPFGTVKSIRTNPGVLPDESINPRLSKLLTEIAINNELIVALANSKVIDMLKLWFTHIKRVGIKNYLVVALDDEIVKFCKSNDVPVYQRDPDQMVDSIGKTGGNHGVSGLKFRVLREFLQLGYGVLLSDVDVIYLQNPFNHLYRDCDIESMSDGHSNQTIYGFDDVSDDPVMGWGRYAHTMRIWVYNSGFFYIRPTVPAIELLDRVAERVAREKVWDQQAFNEELFIPSHPGYEGLHASRRTMDMYLFMNSKLLFKTVRKDDYLKKLKPAVVHLNSHPNKFQRMEAVVQFYVNAKEDALAPFPDGSE